MRSQNRPCVRSRMFSGECVNQNGNAKHVTDAWDMEGIR